jgi:uncharacterized damage-inducible protein DinB
MNIYGGKELAAGFRQVRGNTIRIAEDIPEEQYGFTPAADSRSIGQTLAHVAIGPGFQLHIHSNRIDDLTKVNFPRLMQDLAAEEKKTRTKAETIAFLTSEGERFASYLDSLPDDFLAESVAMPPGAEPSSKTRLTMLMSAKEHEMHHRGQLMLLERIIGVTPHLTRESQARMARPQQAAAEGSSR